MPNPKTPIIVIKGCAIRGRSSGDWLSTEHKQVLEIGEEYANSITSVYKDSLTIEINNMEETKRKYRIRKLTPRECFRLMGVRDNEIDTIQATGISDSAQYKLAGNSIVVNVLVGIFKNLLIDTEKPEDTLF